MENEKRLTPKQKRFVEEYLIDLNATAAAGRAGYSDPNIGRQLITKDNVAAEIAKRGEDITQKTGITQKRILNELAAIAFADITDFAEVDGPTVVIHDTHNIPKEKIGAIAGIEQGNFGIKLKLNDKLKAIELLMKYKGMDREKEDGATVKIVDDVQ